MLTAIVSFSIGYVSGIYRNEISEKAKELYIRITEKR